MTLLYIASCVPAFCVVLNILSSCVVVQIVVVVVVVLIQTINEGFFSILEVILFLPYQSNSVCVGGILKLGSSFPPYFSITRCIGEDLSEVLYQDRISIINHLFIEIVTNLFNFRSKAVERGKKR